jgi:hypothetical protein
VRDVTADFMTAAKAVVRRPKGRVEVVWTDATIDPSIVVTANEENRGAQLPQAADGQSVERSKWFVLGESTLDGTFSPAPTTVADLAKYQVAWFGETQSGVGGGFDAPAPEITVGFSARPITYLFVAGNEGYNQYPVDFTIEIYEGVALADTITVTDNDDLYWQGYPAVAIAEATSIVLTITKWSAENAIVKISEFYTGVSEIYDGDDILSFTILEETETVGASLPIGNISANQIDLRLQNIEGRFYSANEASPIRTQIKRNRIIRAWLGFELPDESTEWVAMGKFWSGDWDTPEIGSYAQTTGNDIMEMLRKSTFDKSEVYFDITLYDLAITVFEAAKLDIPALDYIVSAALQAYTVPVAWFDQVSYFEALRQIAIACAGRCFADRDGVVVLRRAG